MSHDGWLPAIAFAVALVVSVSSVARAQEPVADPPEYTSLIEAAVAEFAAGHWPEARALFERAHALVPNARTWRGIGMASFEMRDYPEAVRTLEAALASMARPLTDEQRTSANDLLTRARALTGRFVIPAAPAGARLYVDGAGADAGAAWPAADGTIVLAVGAHTIAIRAANGRSVEARVTVRGSEDARLDVDVSSLAPQSAETPPVEMDRSPLPPPGAEREADRDREGTSSSLPWVVLGAGGGTLAIGAAFLYFGLSEIDTVESSPIGTEWADVEDAETRGSVLSGIGVVAITVGIVTAGAGLVLLAIGDPEDQEHASLELRAVPGSFALAGRFR